MRNSLKIAGVLTLGCGLTACNGGGKGGGTTPITGQSVADAAFQSAVCMPPKDWKGPGPFKLSHDYPETAPGGGAAEYPWLGVKVDFTSEPKWDASWEAYTKAILDYVKQGQDAMLTDEKGWSANVGGATRWFHVPWMATNKHSGREFVHGLTNERTTYVSSFLDTGTRGHNPIATDKGSTDEGFPTWAFGVYNPVGGYALGQAIPKSGVPAAEGKRAKGLPFAQGTLVVKLLFTGASAPAIPFLENSPSWTANIHVPGAKDKDGFIPRSSSKVQLAQMDVAVVDERSPMRWVFGTFVYNSKKPNAGTTAWDHLSILGFQWGSDPKAFPAVDDKDAKIMQSVLAPIDIFEHYGAHKRLAGPLDNEHSSCLSCHQAAYAAAPVGTVSKMGTKVPPANIPAAFGFNKNMGKSFSPQNTIYFGNYPFPSPYPLEAGGNFDAIALDTSMQLYVAFQSYAQFPKP